MKKDAVTTARILLRMGGIGLLGLWLSACSSLPGWGEKNAKDRPNDDIVWVPAYQLEINAPTAIRLLLLNFLDLARFQTAPASDTVSSGELNRLIAAAPAQARALLETEGYFSAEVTAQRLTDGTPTPIGDAASADPAILPRVVLSVNTGPRVIVESLTLDVQGPLRESLQQANPASITTWGALHRDWLLRPDSEFRQPRWSAAKAAMLDRLRSDGYPEASWLATEARIDVAAHTAALDVTADSGTLYRLGRMRIEGLQRHDESSVRNVANFREGTAYSERLLIDYSERLRKLNLFESTVVELDPEVLDATAATVIVRLRELPLQQATVGLGLSDNTGPRITLEHTHRRVFGRPWVAKNKIEWGRDRQILESELISHPVARGYRNLLAVNASREEAQGTRVESSRLRIGRSLDTERIERLAFAEALTARTSTPGNDNAPSANNNNRAVSGNFHWIWRDLDSVLLPTDGTAWNLQGALGQARSQTASDGPFGRVYARFSGYSPLGKTWYGSARVEAAQLFAADAVGIPDPLLFRAGGDESVRGYAYRSIGPLKDGVVSSGRVLLTGSVELARPFSARLPSLWWATFFDAGQAADRWGDWHPVYGYGVGLRWRSPVGALKLDLAYGEALQKVRLHLSIGIAF